MFPLALPLTSLGVVATSLLPSFIDLFGMFGYVFGNPYLFIGSSTVITSTLISLVLLIRLLVPLCLKFGSVTRAASLSNLLLRVAPTMGFLLFYFGSVSMLLSLEIFWRFHTLIPEETETQLRSGAGHILLAGLGILLLLPYLRRRSVRTYLVGNILALSYWSVNVQLITPPWFHFQDQGDVVIPWVSASLGVGYVLTGLFWLIYRYMRLVSSATGPESSRPARSR